MILLSIDLPLEVNIGKKNFILNMNNYRNAHYQKLNNAKKNYTDIVLNLLPKVKAKKPVCLIYTLYPKTKRRIDLANPLSIIDKFTSDAIVQAGILQDDNTDHIKEVVFKYGNVDKTNPRAELTVMEI